MKNSREDREEILQDFRFLFFAISAKDPPRFHTAAYVFHKIEDYRGNLASKITPKINRNKETAFVRSADAFRRSNASDVTDPSLDAICTIVEPRSKKKCFTYSPLPFSSFPPFFYSSSCDERKTKRMFYLKYDWHSYGLQLRSQFLADRGEFRLLNSSIDYNFRTE
jgi:hypothetical protein